MKYYWKIIKKDNYGQEIVYYFYTYFDFDFEGEDHIELCGHDYEYYLTRDTDFIFIAFEELPEDVRNAIKEYITKEEMPKLQCYHHLKNDKIGTENDKIGSKKYVDEKIAICEHNYHILRGDFNEYIRKANSEKTDNFKTFADIYERLDNIRTYINITLLLSIIANIVSFIFWVALCQKS